jgi:hypothetical protein
MDRVTPQEITPMHIAPNQRSHHTRRSSSLARPETDFDRFAAGPASNLSGIRISGWLTALLASWAFSVHAQTAASDDLIVATYDNGAITRSDVESVIATRVPTERANIAKPGGVVELVDRLLRYDLLVQEARARGYDKNVVVVDSARRKAYELMIATLFTVDPKTISKAEIERAFEEHRREFTRPYMRRATRIVCRSETEAAALIARSHHGTREEFAKLAREHSVDPATRSQGGELGYFDEHGQTEQGRVVVSPQLTAAVYALAHVGDVTPHPVPGPEGYSVLKWTGEMKAFRKKQEDIDETLSAKLAGEKGNAALEAFVASLRDKLKPVVHPELLDQIELGDNQPLGIPEGFPAAPTDPRALPKIVPPDND